MTKPLKFTKEYIAKRKADSKALAQALCDNLNRVVLEEDAKEKAEKLANEKKAKVQID